MTASSTTLISNNADAIERRAGQLLTDELHTLHRRTDRMFAMLMVVQWVAAIVAAWVLSPRTWVGSSGSIHPHVYQAIILGGLINALPLGLAVRSPGRDLTRYVIASAQMLWSALLIHVSGGRIETHFHVFGSLAFLSFYRDWRVFIPATIVVTLDHLIRGIFLPESVYGVLAAGPWRTVEHGGWVIFETVFLVQSCRRSRNEMDRIARQRAALEQTNATIESEVRLRTQELATANMELKSKTEDLAQQHARLVAVNAHLDEARAKLEAAGRSKDEFLANMSHELRTPMAAILGYADMLLEPGALDGGANDPIEAIQTIRRSGNHLLRLINDILDLSKIEAGRMQTEQIEVDPVAVLSEVARLTELRAAEKKIAIHFKIDGSMPSLVNTDPTRLRQVLINLVGNAVKFTNKGSVRVTMRYPVEAAGCLRFNIADSGIGMTPEQACKLFLPFQQADASTARQFGGTGLGLFVSKRLAQLLGGDVTLVETGPTGTTFQVVVSAPRAARSLERSESDANKALRNAGNNTPTAVTPVITAGSCTSKHILLAEDGLDNQRLLMHMLNRIGATVVLAVNGREAVDLAIDARDVGRPFDLILMDMQMPVMDGFTATAELRKLGFTTPVVALTAYAMVGDREKCIAAGCDDYTSKPVSKANLISIVQRYVGASIPVPAAVATPTPVANPA